ncbi:DUF6489 family protein [Lentisalinibacter sediminis]|uniref:DUF6489 family protein n=1 Tax=Lentisalinibacter sediminis TaxID=2992237 RepID=UPI0038672E30
MKIKLEFDLTPKEFRDSLGLPDVSGLQKKAVDALQKRVENDIKNFDASKLFNAWVSQGLETSAQVQRFLGKAVGTALRGRQAPDATMETEEDEEASRPPRTTKKKK